MRTEARTPWTPYPPLAALAFIALVVGNLWWTTRDTNDPPEALSTAGVEVARARPAAKAAPAKVPAPVGAFVAFAESDLPVGWPETRSETAKGLRLLAAAMAARGDSILWRDRALRLDESAAAVEQAPDAHKAASAAHDALVQAAGWIEDLRPAAGAAGSTHPVVAAVQALDAGEPLREQAKELKRFFHAAALALGGAKT